MCAVPPLSSVQTICHPVRRPPPPSFSFSFLPACATTAEASSTSPQACASSEINRPCPHPHPTVYLPNLTAFLQTAADAKSTTQEEWAKTCAQMHAWAGWEHFLWDEQAATRLVSKVSLFLLPARRPGAARASCRPDTAPQGAWRARHAPARSPLLCRLSIAGRGKPRHDSCGAASLLFPKCGERLLSPPAGSPPRCRPASPQFYPGYLPMWRSVQSAVQRADMLKYFLMHAIGGASPGLRACDRLPPLPPLLPAGLPAGNAPPPAPAPPPLPLPVGGHSRHPGPGLQRYDQTITSPNPHLQACTWTWMPSAGGPWTPRCGTPTSCCR